MNTDLMEKYLHGTLTADEAAALAQAMAENPALADEFAAATRIESELRAALHDDGRTAFYTGRMERAVEDTAAPVARRRWPRAMAAAAGITLLAGAGWALLETQQKSLVEKVRGTGRPGGKIAQVPAAGMDVHEAVARAGDAAAMKRKLRRFVASGSGMRAVPVSQALASLEQQWKTYAHADAKEKDVTFTVAEAARKLWPKPEDEPAVSLEIPGISLLTGMELIAAQAGLRATVSGRGVSLEPETQKDDGKPRKWTLPLSAAAFSNFLSSVQTGAKHARQEIAQNNANAGFSLLPLMDQTNTSWMESKSAANLAAVRRGMKQAVAEASAKSHAADGSFQLSEVRLNPDGTTGSPAVTGSGEAALRVWIEEPAAAAGNPAETDVSFVDINSGLQSIPEAALTGRALNYTASHAPEPHQFSWQMEDDYLIDLSLAPEVVEFEGFINYGEPIQTTGINALGQSRDVILTDSRIEQPVFLDPPATLTRLIAAHGVNTAGVTWDSENGSIAARGTLRELRTLSATVTAVKESASAGATIQVRVLEWKDGVVPPAERESGILTSAEAAALTKQAEKTVTMPSATARMGQPVKIGTPGGLTYQYGPTSRTAQFVDWGWAVEVSGITAQGLTMAVNASLVPDTTWTSPDNMPADLDVKFVSKQPINTRLADGEWYRHDFPAGSDGKAITFLLRVQPATLQYQHRTVFRLAATGPPRRLLMM